MINTRFLAVLLTALFLAACGGGGGGGGGADTGGNGDGNGNDNGDGNGGDEETTLTGVFLDSAVAGIGYRTETQEGETSADGEFEYLDGETVTFFIGDVELPEVEAGGILTPLDLFGTDDFEDQRVLNLARLLQSLDEDGDPANGITLADGAHSAATGLTLDFDVPTETFEANADVINLVSNGGGPGTLVSAEQARSHLLQLSLVGSWTVAGGDDGYIVAAFMADGTYLIAEGEDADDAGKPGVEYGTYTWNPLTGELTATPEIDTNGEWGLSHPQPNMSLLREGDQMIFRETVDGEEEESPFVRLESADNPLVGGWVVKQGEALVFIAFDGDYYAHAEIAEDTETGWTGVEFGTYSWETDLLTTSILVDYNGDWGPGGESFVATVEGDVLTVDPDDDEPLEFARVK